MSQYKTGTATVTNGSPTVTGTNTLWLANVTAGDSFTVAGDGVMYYVASVDTDTQVTLSAPYAGTTASGAVYAIGTGFTVPDSFPEMSQGDIETATIFTRAMRKIQGKFSSILTGGASANFTAMPQVGGSPLVEPATTTQIGTVEKATTTEAKAGTADKFPDVAGVHAAFNQYGLGTSSPAVTDANNVITPGTFSASGVGALNFPGVTGYGILRVSGRFSGLFLQEAMYGGDQYYIRYTSDSGSTWTDWEQIYHTGMTPDFPNMPQVGGDPIVESGSNADGEFTRWADGTQICYKTDATFTAISGGGRMDAPDWDYPSAFSATPAFAINLSPIVGAGSGAWNDSDNSQAKVSFFGARDSSFVKAVDLRIHAIAGQSFVVADFVDNNSLTAVGRWQ